MAKRFTDSAKWDDPWFAELPSKYKLFYLYLLDECDHAGVWKVNFRKAQFMVGESLEQSEVRRFMSDRIHVIDEAYWHVSKFIKFQYGMLRNDRMSLSALAILEKHGLTDVIENTKEAPSKPLSSPFVGVKDKDKDKDMDKDMVMGKDKEEEGQNLKSNYSPDFESAWELYQRKGAKKEAYKSWQSLTDNERQLAVKAIPAYLQSKPDVKYRKDFERYLKSGAYEANMIPASASTEPTYTAPSYHKPL
jgi:hypothetical protein